MFFDQLRNGPSIVSYTSTSSQTTMTRGLENEKCVPMVYVIVILLCEPLADEATRVKESVGKSWLMGGCVASSGRKEE